MFNNNFGNLAIKGFYNIIGKIWERVSDWYHPRYYTVNLINNWPVPMWLSGVGAIITGGLALML